MNVVPYVLSHGTVCAVLGVRLDLHHLRNTGRSVGRCTYGRTVLRRGWSLDLQSAGLEFSTCERGSTPGGSTMMEVEAGKRDSGRDGRDKERQEAGG